MTGEHLVPVAPMLAALLRLVLPAAVVVDVGEPFGRIFPWWPGAMCGIADASALPAAERHLLRGFHQGGPAGTRPILGLDLAADAGLLSGVQGDTANRLVCEGVGGSGRGGHWAAPNGLVLRPAGPARTTAEQAAADPDAGRILLLIGSAARIEPWELLLPDPRTETLFAALRVAADTLAAAGEGWQADGRVVSPRLATIALLRHRGAHSPPLRIMPNALPHDLPVPTGVGVPPAKPPASGGLATGAAPRVRLLLGLLPPTPMRLRLRFRGRTPRAVFLDGVRQLAQQGVGPDGVSQWEVPMHPAADFATVLGLALPEGGLTIDALDLLA